MSVRWRSLDVAKFPAPRPIVGRSSNTFPASRQYLPRVEEAAVRRPAPCSVGAVSVSLVSWSTRSPIAPPIPLSLNATDVKATSGITHAMARAAIPMRRRRQIPGQPRVDQRAGHHQAESHQDEQESEVARDALFVRERFGGHREGVL